MNACATYAIKSFLWCSHVVNSFGWHQLDYYAYFVIRFAMRYSKRRRRLERVHVLWKVQKKNEKMSQDLSEESHWKLILNFHFSNGFFSLSIEAIFNGNCALFFSCVNKITLKGFCIFNVQVLRQCFWVHLDFFSFLFHFHFVLFPFFSPVYF